MFRIIALALILLVPVSSFGDEPKREPPKKEKKETYLKRNRWTLTCLGALVMVSGIVGMTLANDNDADNTAGVITGIGGSVFMIGLINMKW